MDCRIPRKWYNHDNSQSDVNTVCERIWQLALNSSIWLHKKHSVLIFKWLCVLFVWCNAWCLPDCPGVASCHCVQSVFIYMLDYLNKDVTSLWDVVETPLPHYWTGVILNPTHSLTQLRNSGRVDCVLSDVEHNSLTWGLVVIDSNHFNHIHWQYAW